tara:strand:+ start:553 stop:660 length:108 start_codon:yes stop_codon:yes gene_type:complete
MQPHTGAELEGFFSHESRKIKVDNIKKNLFISLHI